MRNGMFDVSHKHDTLRKASAQAIIRIRPATLGLIREGKSPKGNIIEAAKISGTIAAKQTPFLIPYCHPIPIDHVKVEVTFREDAGNCAEIIVRAEVKTIWKTGVEMEALTAACIAALTIYDMLKPVDDSLTIGSVKLLEKHGGISEFYKKQSAGDNESRPLRAAVLVTSDSRDEKQDESGRIVMDKLIENGFEISDYKVIPDDISTIEEELKRLADELRVDMVITSGGTGLGARDVTPDATIRVIEKEIEGVSETLRAFGQRRTPTSMLSRAVAGTRKNTVIINLPGSATAVSESMDALFPGILHAYELLQSGYEHRHDHH